MYTTINYDCSRDMRVIGNFISVGALCVKERDTSTQECEACTKRTSERKNIISQGLRLAGL